MKRILLITLLITLTISTCTPAFAGWFGAAKDWALDNALSAILASIFILVGGFFGGTTWGKAILRAKLPIKEATDIIVKVHAARRADSPGGKSLTPEERSAVWQEVEQFLNALVTTFGKGK